MFSRPKIPLEAGDGIGIHSDNRTSFWNKTGEQIVTGIVRLKLNKTSKIDSSNQILGGNVETDREHKTGKARKQRPRLHHNLNKFREE